MKLQLQQDSSKIFWTGDTHWGHSNILKYDNEFRRLRPFDSIEEHDEALVSRWNEVVPADGVVIHGGDVFFCKTEKALWLLHRLNGEIHLVLGNHDKAIKGKIKDRFTTIADRLEIKTADSDRLIVVDHYALQVWNKSHWGAWHLHAHSHTTLKTPDHMLRLDIGVPGHNCYPWTTEEIKKHMETKTWKPIDHHTPER